ncbi:UNKNOWN [Stylonychia lemnae]|uniref:Uncharacterized protein n=1 Tax=Stylonychia lemnae TaxID=5949 RepID=A0A077ZZY9_STYLE|nr:UNKNOWN [Stylonychia lemnae]|eukprot:CDW75187.1 UNKNOWN [Stylonychia lemnae]
MEKTQTQLNGSLLSGIQRKATSLSKRSILVGTLATLACTSAIYMVLSGNVQQQESAKDTMMSLSTAKSFLSLDEVNKSWRLLSLPSSIKPENSIDNVQLSPNGNLYVTAYAGSNEDGSDSGSYVVYHYNLTSQIWGQVESSFSLQGVDFTNLPGSDEYNMLLYDSNNAIHQVSQRDFTKVERVSQLEITPSGTYHILREEGLSDSEESLDQLQNYLDTNNIAYVLYESEEVYQFELRDENALILNQDQKLQGFGDQCLNDVTVGKDGSLWGLACDDNSEFNSLSQVIQWVDKNEEWVALKGVQGSSIAALDSEKLIILQNDNKIWINFA